MQYIVEEIMEKKFPIEIYRKILRFADLLVHPIHKNKMIARETGINMIEYEPKFISFVTCRAGKSMEGGGGCCNKPLRIQIKKKIVMEKNMSGV